ncbi:MAG: acyl-ACP--UDP-N-acetylglucosamine O-acyltransferase [Saprospiraceae bacterium]|nr:acyl-ACP--UDP-N-acetylglucosamine O-acyltransferase [Saprospiraceae bacterium]MBK7812397.1 acyl-ACP--UDP-N-acetylglucosamine O-acyltransferase [Saprospiraceae bacterium]MBK9632378.1 acyl-ACP--UDP-N-acetylglucosamine O-acyltransferase [Saprospiraceae bacterium]
MTSPLSNISSKAKIGTGTKIEPFVSIYDDVVIGENCWIGPYVTIMDGARIGNNVKIFPGAVISSAPQDLKFNGENTTIEIGDHTIIREFCTLNKGTKASMTTRIGSHCLLMAYVHVAHDCIIHDHVILANNVTLAGHIEIFDFAILGGLTAVHQFTKVGAHTMIGGGSLVSKDVPPFIKAGREPLMYEGVNVIGLGRRGFDKDQIDRMHEIYRYMFVKHRNISKALEAIENELPDSNERKEILQFVSTSERGLIKGLS